MTSVSSICTQIVHHLRQVSTKLCLATLLFGSVSGCGESISEHGHTINQTELAKVEISRSKRADIVNALGPPSFEGAFDKKKLYYVSQTMSEPVGGRNTTTARHIYIFSFDSRDVLQAINLIDKDNGLNVAHISEKTPTSGNDFGVLDQIFANIKRRKANE